MFGDPWAKMFGDPWAKTNQW